jgi:hypothetical protein
MAPEMTRMTAPAVSKGALLHHMKAVHAMAKPSDASTSLDRGLIW